MSSSHKCPDTRTLNISRCKLSHGNDRYVEVKEWKGDLRVDMREYKDDKPTKKGISLTLMRWRNWVNYLVYADQAMTEKQNYMSHLGGNVYCTVTAGSTCMDVRQYWKPQEEVVPTKKGLCLRPLKYNTLKEFVPESEMFYQN